MSLQQRDIRQTVLLLSITTIVLCILYHYKRLATVQENFISVSSTYIWQTYKTKELPKEAAAAKATWVEKNPERLYFLYDDKDIENYIISHWSAENKDMYEFYKNLPVGVMKADLWRYLILATHGGVYSDIDSECLKPIHAWEEEQKLSASSGNILMIALENDEHFCQWTIYATKEHPIMKHVCQYILDSYLEKGIDKSDPNFVHATTGPGIWTEAIKDYLMLPTLSAKEIFEAYKRDTDKFNNIGLYILDAKYFASIYSKNLYGSQTFGDGYVKWIDEIKKII
jgi:mannosyltransferase OCH1-like enzyme